MIIIPATRVTEPSLVSTNVPLDEVEWTAGTYATGVRRRVGIELYEVVAIPDTTDEPVAGSLLDPPSWLRVSSVNRWRMFALEVGSRTEMDDGTIDVTINNGGLNNAVAFFGLRASNILIEVDDPTTPRRNLLTRTENFGFAATWVPTANITVTDDTENNSNAELVADTLDKSGPNVEYIFQEVTVVAGLTYVASIELKQDTAAQTKISLFSASMADEYASIVIDWTNPAAFGQPLGSGWYRFSLSGVAVNTGMGLYVYPSGDGAAVGSVFASRAQLESGGTPSSHQQVLTDGSDWDTRVYSRLYSLSDNTGINNEYQYCFGPIEQKREFIVIDLPAYAGVDLRVRIVNEVGAVAVGEMIVGRKQTLGVTLQEYGVRFEDFSRKERQAVFGEFFTVIERGFAKISNYEVLLNNNQAVTTVNRLARVRALPTVYIGDILRPETYALGFFETFDTLRRGPETSVMSLEINGLTDDQID